MTSSRDDDERKEISRRRTLQGMGAVLGTAALGCGDDSGSPSAGTGTSGSSTAVGSDTELPGGTAADGTASSTGLDDTGSGDSTGTPPIEACAAPGDLSPEELLAEVDTVVIVMMENRSFDHYFGSATFLEDYVVDGLSGRETNPRLDGSAVQVYAMDNLTPADPPHGWNSCHEQWNNGANDGFVRQHESIFPQFHEEVMGYHVRAQLPIIYALADNYVLCDQWYSSVLGPTWPNRFYLNCATSGGMMGNEGVPGLPTIWEVLESEGVSATNYYSDLAWVWGGLADTSMPYVDPIEEFFDAAEKGTLPSFSIVEPNYGLIPGSVGGNDDHPSHDITLGQIFLGSVYQALAQSPQWERCLLIITYDEHGGFYDHVPPPTATDERREFRQLGFRVPSLVIGPHVRRGCVDSTVLDHVSPIATATRRFGLPSLNDRVDDTNDVSSAIDPAFLGNPQPPAPIPVLTVSVEEVLRKQGTGQEELRDLVVRGEIPLPADRRHEGASRQIALRMLERAQKLGVARLVP